VKKLLIVVAILLIALPAHAARRGLQKNVWASWYNVTTSTTVTLPYESRDVLIKNGASSNGVCVSLRGGTITQACHPTPTTGKIDVINLAGGDSIHIQDQAVTTLTLKAISIAASASPVTVISSY